MTDAFPFDDDPHTSTITTVHVLEHGHPILFASHDADDGRWQFLCGTTNDPSEGRIVGLHCLVELDPTIAEVADLPLGWYATRDEPGGAWHREQRPPEDEDDD
ncbi:MAG TPA: hypothetical protein VGF28_03120 [Thermoanaerobaculia bacterium]|jgi:hypothetical protein